MMQRSLLLIFMLLLPCINAHAGMVFPTSRNSIDRSLPDFEGGKSPNTPCTCANGYENEYPATNSTSLADSTCWKDEGVNYNSHAYNLRVVKANSSDECCDLCKQPQDPQCTFFTWTTSNECYLKSSSTGRTPLSGAISGGTGVKPPFPPKKDGQCKLGVRKDGGEGQPCLWWSQGCSIGCDVCATNLTDGKPPLGPITGNPPKTGKAGFRKSYCKNPKTNATLPRKAWTMNFNAIEGSVNDSYRFNPWVRQSCKLLSASSYFPFVGFLLLAARTRQCPRSGRMRSGWRQIQADGYGWRFGFHDN
jgi:hypothetical protein